MNEIIFLVEESPEEGYIAKALGFSIFTEASTWQTLQTQVKDAVQCHFDEAHRPQLIRLHFNNFNKLIFCSAIVSSLQ